MRVTCPLTFSSSPYPLNASVVPSAGSGVNETPPSPVGRRARSRR